MALTDSHWAELRQRIEASSFTILAEATEYGSSRAPIYKRVSRDGARNLDDARSFHSEVPSPARPLCLGRESAT